MLVKVCLIVNKNQMGHKSLIYSVLYFCVNMIGAIFTV